MHKLHLASVIGATALAAAVAASPLAARDAAPKLAGECGVVTFAFADQGTSPITSPKIILGEEFGNDTGSYFANGHVECFPAVLTTPQTTVVLHAHVSADGKVGKVDVANDGGYPALGDFAAKVLKNRLKVTAPMNKGMPVDLDRDVTVSFEKHA